MANSSCNHQEQNHASAYLNGTTQNNGNSVVDNTVSGLKHNSGVSLDWTLEEQAILEDGLRQYSSHISVIRYAKIAMQLQDKTVRDVAFRCKWMTRKENNKRRKESLNATRKGKDRKERSVGSTKQGAARPKELPINLVEFNDRIPYKAIGGAMGETLEQNAQVVKQIYANLAAFKTEENIRLLWQFRDNIYKIVSNLPQTTKQLPPVPFNLNENLASAILPPPSYQLQS